MVFDDYKHEEIEQQILEFWKNKKIVEKLREKNKKGRKWSFLQGPPYTSGRIHLGHAWNYALKDMALRYKRSKGFNVWDRNGYDVHGLPTAHKVMAKHNMKTKEEIEKFGIDKFIKECEDYSKEMAAFMDNDFKRIGCTIDYVNPYMALTNDYMEGEWWMIKEAWKKDRIYLGEKVMTWCAGCETAVAKHECEYKVLEEDSIFLKFPVKKKNNKDYNKDKNKNKNNKEFLIIWTTTPWTIPFNLAIMVNPELDYVKAKVDDEVWIVGKGLVGPLVQSVVGKSLTILEEFKGKELEGLGYLHPWENDISKYKELKKEHPNVHTVILSEEYVDFSAGSGLVHCAPGCGPEDQEVGRKYDIPPFNSLNEKGEFDQQTGKKFIGLTAKADDQKFIEELDKAGALIATTKVEHDYPTCWRCHNPVIFRTTKQWFFKIEDLRDAMISENQKVNWIPKTQAFDAWTANLKDNSITRQRFWGTPVPLWKCNNKECDYIDVIGSIKELKEKAGKVPKNLHRPWIDDVVWKCKKCSDVMRRIPDILDVWIDSGTASWNCFYYPAKNNYFKDFFPADLILEATEQVRLWFSMLSICSQLAMGKNSYKNVYMHGMLRDIGGQKMSKSLGNIISPYELIDKYGADCLRYYMCQTNSGKDISFSWDECKTKSRSLQVLWNIHKLLINLSKENKINPFKLDGKIIENVMDVEEKYIISRLNSTIKEVTELFENYRLDETIIPLEELFLELSRTYIQMIRDKSSVGDDQDKEVCVYTIAHVLLELIKMFSIVSPFICEAIYLNLKNEFGLGEESISHYLWPKLVNKKIDISLEKQISIAKNVIQSALNSREKAKLGLRWPVKELVIISRDEETINSIEILRDIIKKQTNVKSISVLESLPGIKINLKPDFGKIGPVYGKLSTEIITKLTIDSPETILGHFDKENCYKFKLGNEKVNITQDMIIIERDVPKLYQEAEFRNGFVYLNTERTEELESEGFAREIMRNVQSLRKKAGMEKLDRIVLFLKTNKEMKTGLDKFKAEIEEKVGAEKMEISFVNPVKKHQHNGEFKVKNEKFAVWFDKI
ncbi:MAG: isoleucine--tRNA ligase [Nanoarchaeota archaeon]